MQPSPFRDFILGLFVLFGLSSVGYLSLQVGGLYYNGPSGFRLTATFDEIGDLKPHAAVVVAGVKIGEVVSIELDEFLRANCVLDIDPALELDVETSASIKTAGLLGEKFVALEPGSSDDMLEAGGEISRTESAISIESLIGKFMNDSGFGED
jgi:phospholipid/cholesterol/gamma-HCH transport system substrate-binding protein